MNEYNSKPHDVANLLKRILREMGEPIIPFSAYGLFMEINHNKVEDAGKRLEMLLKVLDPVHGNIAALNRHTLGWIINFMNKAV